MRLFHAVLTAVLGTSIGFVFASEPCSFGAEGAASGDCVPVPPTTEPVWRAFGHEPSWSLRIEAGQATLTTLDADAAIVNPLPEPLIQDGALQYLFDDGAMRLVIAERLCRDTAIGRPHPQTVTLELGDRILSGCGGDPLRLLAGEEWVVEDIAGAGLVDRSRVTLLVERDGALNGTGGCNRYFGQLGMTGETFSIGPLGSTMMACPEALMNQERAFHEALASADGFDFDATGALLLTSAGKTIILARR